MYNILKVDEKNKQNNNKRVDIVKVSVSFSNSESHVCMEGDIRSHL